MREIRERKIKKQKTWQKLQDMAVQLPAMVSMAATPSTHPRAPHGLPAIPHQSAKSQRSPTFSTLAGRPAVMAALVVGAAGKRRFRLARSAEKEAFSNRIRTFFGRIYSLFSLPFGGAGNFAQVDQGSKGVVLRFGKFDRMLDPGRHQFNVAIEKVIVVPLKLGVAN